jgi:hypothetical protein
MAGVAVLGEEGLDLVLEDARVVRLLPEEK